MVLVIGMLTLRLALRTVLARDRREIAVLIALGISTRDVRTLHLLVHGTLAGGAGAVGAVGGVVLERVLSAPLTRFLGETGGPAQVIVPALDRKSTRLNSSHVSISYAVFRLRRKIRSR